MKAASTRLSATTKIPNRVPSSTPANCWRGPDRRIAVIGLRPPMPMTSAATTAVPRARWKRYCQASASTTARKVSGPKLNMVPASRITRNPWRRLSWGATASHPPARCPQASAGGLGRSRTAGHYARTPPCPRTRRSPMPLLSRCRRGAASRRAAPVRSRRRARPVRAPPRPGAATRPPPRQGDQPPPAGTDRCRRHRALVDEQVHQCPEHAQRHRRPTPGVVGAHGVAHEAGPPRADEGPHLVAEEHDAEEGAGVARAELRHDDARGQRDRGQPEDAHQAPERHRQGRRGRPPPVGRGPRRGSGRRP